mmetsp:Transcript_10245/g.25742  ORF Transcript_10245/g.25742 Transcript_10245/m.25742 type:complete len:235 (+) Transcript_10245:636-1340(+)
MVDETVLGSGVLGLKRTEQSLLRTENLDSGCRVLCKVHQAPCVGDQAGPNKLADQDSQVGRNGLHPVLQVLIQLRAVLANGQDLVAQGLDVFKILAADLGTHGHGSTLLELGLQLLGQESRKRGVASICAHAHRFHALCVENVVCDDLSHFREVPPVPFLNAHGVSVELLIQVIQQSDGLDNHDIHLIRAELQFEARQTVGQTKGHGLQVIGVNLSQQAVQLGPDSTDQLAALA